MNAKTILCYGDSNTHGTLPLAVLGERRRLGPDARWPGVLGAELGPDWRVIEEGLGGRTTVHPDPVAGVHKNGLAVLPAILESHRPLDVVVIMLGTNDLKRRFQLPAVEIGECVAQLVLTTLRSECGPDGRAPEVLLVAPPPVIEAGVLAEIFAGAGETSKRIGPVFAEVARRLGVGFLDAGGVICSSPVDGVHFDAAEHGKLGRAVAAALRT